MMDWEEVLTLYSGKHGSPSVTINTRLPVLQIQDTHSFWKYAT